MSMSCSLYRLTEAEATSARDHPDVAGELLGYAPAPPKIGLLSKLFGKSKEQLPPSREKLSPIGEAETFELGQAWHILHYLFTGSPEGGSWPAAFIMSGGQEVGQDFGYGAPRLITPEQSQEVAAFLNAQTFQSLGAAYVPQDIEAAQVYWRVSMEPAERRRQVEELWTVTQGLQAFFEQVASARGSILIHIY